MTTRDRLPAVRGMIRFGLDMPQQPALACDVTIRNARPILDTLSLDRECFTLVKHHSACLDETDPVILMGKYQEELAPFIQDYLKASWIVDRPDAFFVRRSGLAVTEGDLTAVPGIRVPLGGAHLDYTPIAGPMLAARENVRRGLPIRSYRRLMIVNTWRAISPPPQDFPLALADSSTVEDSDVIPHEYTDKVSGSTWWTAACRYNADQRWYYFPDMTADELVVWKSYDSAQNSKVVHSGFDNREATPHANPRHSIEARFYVYFE